MAVPKNYYNIFDVAKMEGIPKGTIDRAAHNGLRGIAAIEALKAIGHLFKEFEKPVRGGMRKQYGIKRTYYDYWKQTGEAPNLPTGRPALGKKRLAVNIPEELIEEFHALVDKANEMSVIKVSYSDMAAVAIREFIDRRPQFKELKK